MRENDTDPMRQDTRTEPDASIVREPYDTAKTDPMNLTDPSGPPLHSTLEERLPTAAPSGLLDGLRRDRPPPKLTPRASAASEGGEAVAYYGGPRSLPERYDTPGLEPLVEIAVTSPGPVLTEPSAHRLAQRAADARGPDPSPSPSPPPAATGMETVVIRPKSSRGLMWGGSIALVAFAIASAIVIVRIGTTGPASAAPPPSVAAVATETAPAPPPATAPTPATPITSGVAINSAPIPSVTNTPSSSTAPSNTPLARPPATGRHSPTPHNGSNPKNPSPAASPAPSPASSYAQPDRTL